MLEHLHRRTNQLNKSMRSIEAKHNEILTEQQEEINRIHQEAQELIYHYRKINQRERPDHTKPLSFENEHKIDVDFEKQENIKELLNATTALRRSEAASKKWKIVTTHV